MRTKKTEKTSAPATIETIQLDNVTGGCAACGNPAHQANLADAASQVDPLRRNSQQ